MLVLILLLMWTMFALSSVEVEYHSSKIKLAGLTDKEIIDVAKFEYGRSVFFDKKDKYIKNIENYAAQNETFAYIEVVNIETVFPNKYVIHVVEREEVYAVQVGENYCICDENLRVLRKEESIDFKQGSPILLEGVNVNATEVQVGDFLDSTYKAASKNVYEALIANNKDLLDQQGLFKSYKFGETADKIGNNYTSLTIETHSNWTYQINNVDFGLVNKIQYLFAITSEISVDDDGYFTYNGQPIEVDGERYNVATSKLVFDNDILTDYEEVSQAKVKCYFEDK